MVKKGQAAMEFLMTYGWAILAAVIVIGVLASFGVFTPSTYVGTTCTLSQPFGCEKNQVAASASDVSLVIRNGGGASNIVQSVEVSGCGTNSTPITMADQTTQLIVVTCDSALTVGDKLNSNVVVTYMPTGGQLNATASGKVTVEVA